MYVGLVTYRLYVEPGVNGTFNAFVDILHCYCDVPIPIEGVYLKESYKKLDISGK